MRPSTSSPPPSAGRSRRSRPTRSGSSRSLPAQSSRASSRPRAVATSGTVIGGALPATVGADWLTTVWDQCAGLGALGPSASVAEVIVGDWLKELLGLPTDASFAITTGCQMAHVTALAAARHDVLATRGWDVRRQGLAGSPPISVVVGALRHVTVDRALRLLGIGGDQLVVVAADDAGRMRPRQLAAALAASDGPTIVCAQAGEVNTGSYDPFVEIVEIVRETDAWLHVDGAFGLWAAASPGRGVRLDGCADADSWATDGHKWLNVLYDCGFAFCRKPDAHRASMTSSAAYFEGQGRWVRDAADWTPESSRRARAFTVYAALRSLGRDGVAELVDRCCDLARRFASAIAELAGCTVLNDVVINQGALPVRRRRGDAIGARQPAAERRGVDGRDDVAGPTRDPYLRLELEDDRSGYRPHGRRVRGGTRRRLTRLSTKTLGACLRELREPIPRSGGRPRALRARTRPRDPRASSCRRAAGSRRRRGAACA
jgi:glutamate/tyrosine decarboxylase-like PLP-dependent enzyme